MAVSVQASNRFRANNAVQLFDFDPDVTTPVDVSWVPMGEFGGFMVGFFRTIGVGNLTGFKILANTAANGSGTDVEVKVHPLTVQPNAVGDQIWLEVLAEEVRQACTDAGLVPAAVSANVQFATATDEGVVTYVRFDPRFAKDGLTADIVV